MIIRRVMTENLVSIAPDVSVNEARSLMDKEKIGHLPVLDKSGKLVGIVTQKDLIKAGPSSATTLDIYEISYLLSKLKVEKIMERHVITVDENEVVEEAARIMADKHIGCLPVMKGSLLIGIITDTDLFHVFINAFGARKGGVRIVVSMPDRPGEIARLSGAIAEKGGNIFSYVSTEGADPGHSRSTLKISDLSRPEVEGIVASLPEVELEDIRE
ncbi:MAG: CBS and ACT domain-containing protein [Treponema sp.]|nr:CBS and ACT domain-containing protein [Treponema sp.]